MKEYDISTYSHSYNNSYFTNYLNIFCNPQTTKNL